MKLGEPVITSGYSSIYPKGIVIGQVQNISNKKNKLFYEIKVNLRTSFESLSQVYIIKNIYKKEILNLENKTKAFYE